MYFSEDVFEASTHSWTSLAFHDTTTKERPHFMLKMRKLDYESLNRSDKIKNAWDSNSSGIILYHISLSTNHATPRSFPVVVLGQIVRGKLGDLGYVNPTKWIVVVDFCRQVFALKVNEISDLDTVDPMDLHYDAPDVDLDINWKPTLAE